MGRWLSRLRAEEKNTGSREAPTLETFKTSAEQVSRVLKVADGAETEKNPAFDERAAVLEYDEGLSRAEAERLAREQVAQSCGDKLTSMVNLDPTAPAYEALHPETRHGGDRKSDQVANLSTRSFDEETAAAIGQSERAVRFVQPPVVFGPGVTRTLPAVEVCPAEYDAHLDVLIAEAGAGTVEAAVLSHKKRKGICVRRGDEMIYTRGRT